MFWTVHSMACSIDEPVPFTRQHLVEWTGPGPCTLLDKISSEWERGQFYQQTIRIWACQQYIIPTTSQNQYIPKPNFFIINIWQPTYSTKDKMLLNLPIVVNWIMSLEISVEWMGQSIHSTPCSVHLRTPSSGWAYSIRLTSSVEWMGRVERMI